MFCIPLTLKIFDQQTTGTHTYTLNSINTIHSGANNFQQKQMDWCISGSIKWSKAVVTSETGCIFQFCKFLQWQVSELRWCLMGCGPSGRIETITTTITENCNVLLMQTWCHLWWNKQAHLHEECVIIHFILCHQLATTKDLNKLTFFSSSRAVAFINVWALDNFNLFIRVWCRC